VAGAYALELSAERGERGLGQQGYAVSVGLAGSHRDLAPFEVHVLHTEAERFEQAQAGAVEQGCDDALGALDVSVEEKQCANPVATESC